MEMKLNNCELNENVQAKLFEFFVLEITARSATSLLDIHHNTAVSCEVMIRTGEFENKRKKQALDWMWSQIESGLRQLFKNHPQVHASLPTLSEQVASGTITPGVAARQLLAYLRSDKVSLV